jgi:hypothetical protein
MKRAETYYKKMTHIVTILPAVLTVKKINSTHSKIPKYNVSCFINTIYLIGNACNMKSLSYSRPIFRPGLLSEHEK